MQKRLFVAVCSFLLLIGPFRSQVLPQTSEHLQQRYVKILKLMGEEQYDKAILEFQQLVSEYPNFAKAYKKIAEAYLYTNDLKGAENYFKRLHKENPNSPYAYYGLARVDYERGDYNKAIENLKACIALDPTFADAYAPGGGLPDVYQAKNDLDTAIKFFSDLIRSNPKNACAYYGLGRCYLKKYEWDRALKMLDNATELDPGMASAYRSMTFIYQSTNKYQKAFASNQQVLKIAERSNDLEMKSYAIMNIGNFCNFQGDYWRALHHYNEALKISKEIGARKREGMLLNNIAVIYAMLGDYPRALEYFKAALRFTQKTGDKSTEVRTLNNIGNVYKDQGDYNQGLQYYQRALETATEVGHKHGESQILSNLADMYQQWGDYRKALEYHNKALGLAIEIKDKAQEGYVLRNLGSLSQKLGKYEDAIKYHRRALEIGIQTQDAQVIWEAEAGLGSTLEKQGKWDEAIKHYAKAIALFDSVREKLEMESLASGFLEDKYEVYPSIVHLLAEYGRYREAFTYAEKFKAKTLLDILSQGQTRLAELLPDTLRLQLKRIRAQLEAAHGKLSIELSKAEKDKDKIISLDQQITDLELRRAALLDEHHSPYYQLVSSEPLSVEEIQERILGPGQTLVEYLLGPERTSIFIVTSDTLVYQEVALTRDRLRHMMADFSPLFQWEKTPDERRRNQIFNAQLANFSISPAYALYQALFKPVESQLPEGTELTIVPDDILFYLPFEALVMDTTGVESRYDFERAKLLVEKYTISYAPSASVLDPSLRRPRQPTRGLLALGNPDFRGRKQDPVWTRFLASTSAFSGSVVRGDHFVPLPYSGIEVKAVGKVLAGSKNHIYTGKRATEEVFKTEAKDYRILHLSTHFLTNDRQPLYSKIVLAQEEKPQEDGYLQTYEIFDMKLNADLAVLSACNTGLGKLSKGEGLIGVSRAFLYAGVPSLVVSLWSVDDEATSVIMKSFYQYLKAGFDKKQALRFAKVDYLKTSTGERQDPFYWAPFVLIGDWSPVSLPSRSTAHVWRVIILLLLLLVIALVVILKKRQESF